MQLQSENFFHPFLDETLMMILSNDTNEVVLGYIDNLEDVNLYYQPVQIPLIATIFLAIKLLLLVVSEYLLYKIYHLAKKENGLVKDVTIVFVYAQVIFWPVWILFVGSTDFIHPLNEVVGQWYCETGSFLFYFPIMVITSHSFITVLMRYFFIIHRENIIEYGSERAKKNFFLLSIILPLFMALWEMIDGAELDSFSFINKCNGKHHKVFLIDTSTINIAKRNFCGFEQYDAAGVGTQIVSWLRMISCIINKFVLVTIGLNVTEGFLYFRIITYMNR